MGTVDLDSIDFRVPELLDLAPQVVWDLPEPLAANAKAAETRPVQEPTDGGLETERHLADAPEDSRSHPRRVGDPSEDLEPARWRPRAAKGRRTKNMIDDKPALPFIKVSTRIMRDPTLGTNARCLYVVLASYADLETRQCFPSKKLLAKTLACTPRSVQTWTTELVQAGHLLVDVRERGDGGQTSNLYSLLDKHDVQQ
jgi:hypothetical protein